MTPRTFVCIASGPSLNYRDVALVQGNDFPIIAVNSSWIMTASTWRHNNHIYAGDGSWWEVNHRFVTGTARRWCGDEFTAKRFGIECFKSLSPGSFNSGQRAIELAAHLGAERVLLLGYDCSIADGRHWHDDHQTISNPTKTDVARWHGEFHRLADALDVEIINCSRKTALTCFPCETLELAIARSSSHLARVLPGSFHQPTPQ